MTVGFCLLMEGRGSSHQKLESLAVVCYCNTWRQIQHHRLVTSNTPSYCNDVKWIILQRDVKWNTRHQDWRQRQYKNFYGSKEKIREQARAGKTWQELASYGRFNGNVLIIDTSTKTRQMNAWNFFWAGSFILMTISLSWEQHIVWRWSIRIMLTEIYILKNYPVVQVKRQKKN